MYYFVVYEDRAGFFRWRLKASNGAIVADGSEGYSSKSAVLAAIQRVKIHVGSAEVIDLT